VKSVVVDIDGTLADMGKGQPGRRGPFEWSRVGEDTPIAPIVELVNVFRDHDYRIVFVSGRSGECYAETRHWLMRYAGALAGDKLYMRPRDQPNRPDNEVKRELYERYIAPLGEVFLVLDDRDKVVQMWQSLGLTCLQVAAGDF
jgi:hypothetical protein